MTRPDDAAEPDVRSMHDVEPGIPGRHTSGPAGTLTRVTQTQDMLVWTQQLVDRLLAARRDAIRAALDAGHTKADVARALDVTPARVWQILNDWRSG